MGRTEAERWITNEPSWSRPRKKPNPFQSEWRSLLKKCLAGPTLLGMSNYSDESRFSALKCGGFCVPSSAASRPSQRGKTMRHQTSFSNGCLRALRADDYPLAVALNKYVHPRIFPAGVFSVGAGALFSVGALHDRYASQHLYIHGTKFEGLELKLSGFHVRQMALLRFLGAIVANAHPIIGEDLTDFVSITYFRRISPIVFKLLDRFRSARAFGLWRRCLREGQPKTCRTQQNSHH